MSSGPDAHRQKSTAQNSVAGEAHDLNAGSFSGRTEGHSPCLND
jgi:hypothetical protein